MKNSDHFSHIKSFLLYKYNLYLHLLLGVPLTKTSLLCTVQLAASLFAINVHYGLAKYAHFLYALFEYFSFLLFDVMLLQDFYSMHNEILDLIN